MIFRVCLENQLTKIRKVITVKSSYDATSVVEKEAKQKMRLPEAWDVISIVRQS